MVVILCSSFLRKCAGEGRVYAENSYCGCQFLWLDRSFTVGMFMHGPSHESCGRWRDRKFLLAWDSLLQVQRMCECATSFWTSLCALGLCNDSLVPFSESKIILVDLFIHSEMQIQFLYNTCTSKYSKQLCCLWEYRQGIYSLHIALCWHVIG